MPKKSAKATPVSKGQPVRQIQERVPSADHIDRWSNDVLVAHTPWDFMILFGIVKQATAEKLTAEQHVTMRLSPTFMKRVAETMRTNIARYEQTYGEIQMPRGIVEVQEAQPFKDQANGKGKKI